MESKYVAIAAAVLFLLVLWLSDGSMAAAFGAMALVAGLGWIVKRLS